MPIRNIPLTEATDDQKRAFATNFLNLDVAADASPDKIDSAIRQAQPNTTTIFVMDSDEAMQEAAEAPNPEDVITRTEDAGRSVGSLGKGDPRWIINIPVIESQDGSGARDVEVGVNGRAWQIRRGDDVSVPHRVVLALDAAMQTIVEHNMDNGDTTTREARRIGYQVIEKPSKAEIDDWFERTKDEFCA